MDVPEIKYESTDFSAILKKDARFDTRAYDFMLRVITEASESAKGHVTGQELLDYFRDLALDAYGPLAYTVLTEWGVTCCEDVGEIVFNLVNAGLIGKTEQDSPADFLGGFDFKEEFLGPFRAP
ncbi:MAG: Minf_1886 family protein [Kiritimatiellia bacterium]